LAGLVKDYNSYAQMQNISFVGICTSSTATVKTMTKQVETFGLKPFANMLDAGGVTAAAYGVPKNANFWLVVVDGEGKIAYNASRGWKWTGGPQTGQFIHRTQCEDSQKKFPGIIGAKEIPSTMSKAAHYYDLQQLDLVEKELTAALVKDKGADAVKFAELLRAKATENRKARAAKIKELSASDPVQAYRDALSFVAAFPRAPEMSEVNSHGQKLLSNPAVKKEIEAESGFQRIVVPEMKKALTPALFDTKIKPLLDGYMKAYGETKYAAVVQSAADAHREAVCKR
jgi:hypothetical protein